MSAPRVGLSTSSVYPESSAHAFGYAASLGYDAVEVMVLDALSQQISTVKQLSEHHGMPVSAIHAPCLLFTQRVWGTEPWGKLERSAEMAAAVGAEVVVVHPPFRWQRDYASGFVDGIRELERRTGVVLAVENMFPWRARGREVVAYAPGWDPTDHDYEHLTLDISHAATSGLDALALAQAFGDRLAHLHLCDGSGSIKDEHLVPGEGSQPCAEVMQHLARSGFDGNVVMEVNTRKARGRSEREAELAAALAFARTHLAMADVPGGAA